MSGETPSPRLTSLNLPGNGSASLAARITADEARFARAGMNPDRLARIPLRMQAFVDKGTVAGAVMLVARRGAVAVLEAVGYQDLETRRPMRTDTIFHIGSMTKTFTALGIMVLVDQGLLRLSDPVEEHLPEFRGQQIVERSVEGKPIRLRHASRPITIRDVLTHTSGMPTREGLDDVLKGPDGQIDPEKTLAEVVALRAADPLEFEPGTRYLYSNSGFDTLGRIIEVISGEPYEYFLERRIFQPLGMEETCYFPPREKYERIAGVYNLEDGKLKKINVDLFRQRRKYVSPSGGWASTATDMFAFFQMLLSGGAGNGQRIVSAASVALMTTSHTGDLQLTPVGAMGMDPAGLGRGLGLWVVTGPAATLELLSVGAYGHGGVFGTAGWVDPQKYLVGLFFNQRRIHGGPGHGPERKVFTAMATAAIDD